jgi:hypothetical protein
VLKVNPTAIRIETRIQICLDACILSLAFMHSGEVERAHELCNAARDGVERLKKGTESKEYAEALFAWVEILYSKASAPIAELWRDKLLKSHREVLQKGAIDFLPGVKMDPALLDCIEKLKMANTSPASLPDRLFKSQVKGFLHKAIDQGNFSAALFI